MSASVGTRLAHRSKKEQTPSENGRLLSSGCGFDWSKMIPYVSGPNSLATLVGACFHVLRQGAKIAVGSHREARVPMIKGVIASDCRRLRG